MHSPSNVCICDPGKPTSATMQNAGHSLHRTQFPLYKLILILWSQLRCHFLWQNCLAPPTLGHYYSSVLMALIHHLFVNFTFLGYELLLWMIQTTNVTLFSVLSMCLSIFWDKLYSPLLALSEKPKIHSFSTPNVSIISASTMFLYTLRS